MNQINITQSCTEESQSYTEQKHNFHGLRGSL